MSDRLAGDSSVDESSHRQPRVLGRVSAVARVVFGAGILAAFVFSWAWIATAPDTARDVLATTPPLGLFVIAAYLAFSADIRITRAGYIETDGVTMKRTFSVSQIANLSANEGLRFHLKSGKAIQSAAYPGSITGVGSRRARIAQERLTPLLLKSTSDWPQDASVRVSPRLADMSVGLGLACGLLATTLLVNVVLTT